MKRSSKIVLFISLALLGTASNAFAQHCPFDGGNMIVVQLTDADDKPLFGSAADLTLQELGNPDADWCGLPADSFPVRFCHP